LPGAVKNTGSLVFLKSEKYPVFSRSSLLNVILQSSEKGVPILMKVAHSELKSIKEMFGEALDDFLPYAERIKNAEDPARVWSTLPRRFKHKLANAGGHK
jgi:hypothetical protein